MNLGCSPNVNFVRSTLKTGGALAVALAAAALAGCNDHAAARAPHPTIVRTMLV